MHNSGIVAATVRVSQVKRGQRCETRGSCGFTLIGCVHVCVCGGIAMSRGLKKGRMFGLGDWRNSESVYLGNCVKSV